MFLERREMIVERNFKEYTKEQFSKEKNYNAILQKVKGSGVMKKKKILSIAAVLLVVVIVGAMAPNIYANIKWNIEFKEYQNRKVDYGLASINTAVDEYETNIDMDYIYQDEIGVKLEGMLITDDFFKMNIGIKLPEEMEVETDTFSYGYAVYDENNNIYGVFERLKMGKESALTYWKKLYKELGVKYDKKDVFSIQYQDSCQGASVTTSEKGYLSTTASMTSNRGFPKSKHNAKPLRLLKESRSGFYVVFMLVNSIPKTGKSKERLEILSETSIPLHRDFPAA